LLVILGQEYDFSQVVVITLVIFNSTYYLDGNAFGNMFNAF
jgi:hypothetical protein